MPSAINNALSGLAAASARLGVAAGNIANQHSTKTLVNGQSTDTPYTPQRLEQVSLGNGGVITKVKDVDPATVQVPDSDPNNASGLKQLPNVQLERELVELKLATYDFKANLKTIKAEDENLKSLLDILS